MQGKLHLRFCTLTETKSMPTWFKWANILIGIIALILAIGIVFFPFILGAETFVLYLGALLLFTGLLKTTYSFQYTSFPNWLRYSTIIFGIIILVLGIPLILFATIESIVLNIILFAFILIGVFLLIINIQVGVQPDYRRTVFITLGVIVIILILAIWIGNFLGLVAYIFFISMGFFLIALDALATGIFRD